MGRHDGKRGLEEALEVMGAEDLRKVIREILVWAEAPFRGQVIEEVLNQAAAGEAGWIPEGPSGEEVEEALAWAEEALGEGSAEPEEANRRLRLGSAAFRARDYENAREIFGALLVPLGEGEIDVGADDMPGEALGPGVYDYARHYLISVYMTTPPGERVRALDRALKEIKPFWLFSSPLKRMEEAALEPLPDFENFLGEWKEFLVGEREKGTLRYFQKSWLEEALLREGGPEALARLARGTKASKDYLSWCLSLFKAEDWAGALEAFREAAEVSSGTGPERARFLDGAGLAAWRLEHPDFPRLLEEAWKAEPSLPRLLRLLGTAKDEAALLEAARRALPSCAGKELPVRGFLQCLLGMYDWPADALVRAPGLGWSLPDHPGHLVFWTFYLLLGGKRFLREGREFLAKLRLDPGSWIWGMKEEDSFRLTPGVEEILEKAGAGARLEAEDRETMAGAMRRAAEKRIAGLTGKGRYKHYPHGGLLAAACREVGCPLGIPDPWLARILQDFRRYPAMVREIQGHLEPGWA